MWIVKTITGFDIEAEIGQSLGELVLTMVADLVGIESGQVTEVDQIVPSTVTIVDGQALVALPDGIGAREVHRMQVGNDVGVVKLDVRASCGIYAYPERTKCTNLVGGWIRYPTGSRMST